MKRIAIIVALLIGVTLVPSAASSAEPEPVGSLYAFAVQPQGCTAGYIQVNYARGVSGWEVDDITRAPATEERGFRRYRFPGGVQADVYATAAAGYYIPSDVMGSPEHPFLFQVNARSASCRTATTWTACRWNGVRWNVPCVHDSRHNDTAFSTSDGSFKMGDFNDDGYVDIKDITHRRAHYLLGL